MKTLALVGALAAVCLADCTHAYVFRYRFVERVGNVDVELVNGAVDASDRSVHNIRFQVGVFDDTNGPAPAGGFVGWNVGTLEVGGQIANSDERRNPGRLAPFNFASGPNSNGNPPLPGGDPFTFLSEIDATLGTQSPVWVCNPDGSVPVQPEPIVRGRNTFVSVFAFSIDPNPQSVDYLVTARGNLIAGTSWLPVGTPVPPECGDPADPSDDVVGSIIYAPFPTAAQAITRVLRVEIIPSPTGLALFAICGLHAIRRGSRPK